MAFLFVALNFVVLNQQTMKRNVFIFGLILGAILCANMIYMVRLCYTNPDFKSNALIGYAVLIIIFSMIFFGVRNYRNKELDGIISFGKAMKTGSFIALVGATLYVVVWLFYYYLFVPDFMDVYTLHVLKEAAQSGADELAARTSEMETFKELYKSPVWVILITYAEVLPVGLLVALVSAFILKKKPAASH